MRFDAIWCLDWIFPFFYQLNWVYALHYGQFAANIGLWNKRVISSTSEWRLLNFSAIISSSLECHQISHFNNSVDFFSLLRQDCSSVVLVCTFSPFSFVFGWHLSAGENIVHGIYGQRIEDKSSKVTFARAHALPLSLPSIVWRAQEHHAVCNEPFIFLLLFSNFTLNNNVRQRQWICYLWASARTPFCRSIFGPWHWAFSFFISLAPPQIFSQNALHAGFCNEERTPHSTFIRFQKRDELMKFAGKCNAANTQNSKSPREYSIDVCSMLAKINKNPSNFFVCLA